MAPAANRLKQLKQKAAQATSKDACVAISFIEENSELPCKVYSEMFDPTAVPKWSHIMGTALTARAITTNGLAVGNLYTYDSAMAMHHWDNIGIAIVTFNDDGHWRFHTVWQPNPTPTVPRLTTWPPKS